jgi:hypothetical protein
MILPALFLSGNTICHVGRKKDGWRIHYRRIGQLYEQLEAPTEADDRAKMLMYLLENKLVADNDFVPPKRD